MPIEVELDAYVIPSDHRVWKTTAGKTHRFYRAVRDAKAIFPDVRGLDTLEGDPQSWHDKDILRVIASDRALRKISNSETQEEPSDVSRIRKTDRTTLTFLKRIWFEAKKGDLIVVPPDGWREPALVGEITSDVGEIRAIEATDGEHAGVYFGRSVRWKPVLFKQDVTQELLTTLHTRTAVFPMGESVKEEVYRHAYGNYVYNDRYVCEFRISKDRFTTDDSVAVSVWLNGFDVLRNSLEHGDTRNGESFAQLGLDRLPTELAAEMKISIQSPGEIFVRTVGPFALSLMTLFALSGCDAQQIENDEITVSLKQVGAGNSTVKECVENDVNALKTALGQNRFVDASCYARRAKDDARMSTRATLKTPLGGDN